MNLLRIILLPLSLLYGIIVWFRNKLFDWKILPSKSFDIPVISVGNLSMGGTGKSPQVEYLVRLLKDDYKIATLSRGYKRKSKGFVLASENSNSEDIGDEPFQFQLKFDEVTVAVDEKRARGIAQIQKDVPNVEAIILDDAFQHRYVKPGLSVLLTDFHKLYTGDYPVPTGTLREFRSGAKRADIIVVTKTYKTLSPITRKRIVDEIKLGTNQKLYFSYIQHGKFRQVPGLKFTPDPKSKYYKILLFAGIANSYPLEFYLKNLCDELETVIFPDHHQYKAKDITRIVEIFDNIVTQNKIIVTTEKDTMRLQKPELMKIFRNYPVCYVPIEIVFHKDDKQRFNKQIIDYVKKNTRNNEVYTKED
ncbi:MAG: tetraacyldisaccharide 4'-kinase [Bacteroidales bacterium]|nr:tetraacyldisaccharide 4'-kinase [Bacteroidales bacterium]